MCLAFIDSRRPDPGAFWPLGRVPAKGGSRLREWNREGVAGWDQAICRSIDREGGTEWRLPVHPLVELKLGWSVQGPDQRHRVDGFLPIGSPAVDVVPAAECISLTDRLGVTRPQQGRPSGSVACDIGSFERVLGDSPGDCEQFDEEENCLGPPADTVPASPRPQLPCAGSNCKITLTCTLAEGQCTNKVNVLVTPTSPRTSPDFSPVVWKKAVPRGIICSGSTCYSDIRGRPYEHRV